MNYTVQATGPLERIVVFGVPLEKGGPGRSSELWYCSVCGYQYASLAYTHPVRHGPEPFSALAGCCENCAPPYKGVCPGSIWTSWDHLRTEALPQALLEREFELHFNQAHKEGRI